MLVRTVRLRGSRLAVAVAFAVVLVFVAIAYAILRYPAAVSEGNLSSLVWSVLLLLLYGVGAIGVIRQPDGAGRTALGQGALIGLVIGTVSIVHLSVEHFVTMSPWLDVVSTFSVMGFLFVLFGTAGFRAVQRTDSLLLGIVASVWSAMIGMVITCLYGFLFNFTFMSRLENNLRAAYVLSGMDDLQAFTIRITLESAAEHLFQAPIYAAFWGLIGGLLCRGLTRFVLRGSRPV